MAPHREGRRGKAFSSSSAAVSIGRQRRPSQWHVRSIEYRRPTVTVTESATPGYARYIGRVGVLAVALGVGSAIASVPVAVAGHILAP